MAIGTDRLVFPCFGLPARVSDTLGMKAIFTVVGVLGSCALRRVIETVRVRHSTYR